MQALIIENVTVIQLEGLLENAAVLIEDSKIKQVSTAGGIRSENAEVIDGGKRFLAPGFIDLHIHGTGRYLVDNGPDELSQLCRLMPKYGLTGFLPTICPLPKGRDDEFLSSVSEVESEGTQILGFHLEGPFLTLSGALPNVSGVDGKTERVHKLIKSAAPYKLTFSIAPDFPAILDLVDIMSDRGGPVFMTHTQANVQQTQAAIEAGVRHATHFYDVFPCPDVQDPGVRPCGAVEAVLADERVSVDFILDGEHVDPVAVKMALKCKGPDRVCLITDANVGAGMPTGKYKFNNRCEIQFHYEGGPARMTKNGNLTGSGLTSDRAVRNAVKLLSVELPLAVRMASANPARVLGLENSKGQIKQGYDADLVLLDKSLNVLQTWIAGNSVYKKS